MIRVRFVEPEAGFNLRLTFTDGTVRVLDMMPYLRGPIFEPVRSNRAFFEAVRVDPELGTIVWPNGADVCPDVLYEGLDPETVSPSTSPKFLALIERSRARQAAKGGISSEEMRRRLGLPPAGKSA